MDQPQCLWPISGELVGSHRLSLMHRGTSGAMLKRLYRFARTEDSVVFQGEPGSGKTQLAELLHSHSPQSRGPFLSVNLAGLDDAIANSELFGYVPGAFTDARHRRPGLMEAAKGGTLLLDEMGKASLAVQRRLLDVIERHRYRPVGSDRDVPLGARLVFAANEPLDTLVSSGQMLRDFLPRLGLFRIVVPALRERKEEIPALIDVLIERHALRFGYTHRRRPTPTPALVAALQRYRWPNNVRELDTVIRRLLADAEGAVELNERLLRDDLACFRGEDQFIESPVQRLTPDEVRATIARFGGNKSEAARHLGIGRTSLYRILGEDESDEPLNRAS